MLFSEMVGKFGRNDAKLIARDRFLLFMFGFIVYIAVALRFFLPWLDGYLAERGLMPSATISDSFATYFPLVVGYLGVYQGAQLTGTIFGFALLDEKDDDTLTAMLVTPIPLTKYILYRVALPTVLAAFIVIFMVLLINQALLPLWQLIFISIGAAFGAPIAALFYGIFATNKVQGFAMAKFMGLIGWIILGAWFVAEPMQWLFGIFPPYWIVKAYWMALEGHVLWPVALVVGIFTQIGLVWVMARMFARAAYR